MENIKTIIQVSMAIGAAFWAFFLVLISIYFMGIAWMIHPIAGVLSFFAAPVATIVLYAPIAGGAWVAFNIEPLSKMLKRNL